MLGLHLARFITATTGYANALKAGITQLQLAYSSNAAAQRSVIEPWLKDFKFTPPVKLPADGDPPTAQSWLRRLGASTMDIYKMFRIKQVRIYDGTRVKRLKNRAHPLNPGEVLLVPKEHSKDMRLLPVPPGMMQLTPMQPRTEQDDWSTPAAATVAAARAALAQAGRPAAPAKEMTHWEMPQQLAAPPPPQQQQVKQQKAIPWEVQARQWLVACEKEWIVVKKLPYIPVQATSSSTASSKPPSIEQLLPAIFRTGLEEQLELVHTLPTAASGCLLVARNRKAAAWLKAAFEHGHAFYDPQTLELTASPDAAPAEHEPAVKGRRRPAVKPKPVRKSKLPLRVSVHRVYIAVVQGNMEKHREGIINKQVPVRGQLQHAKTAFKVRYTGEGFTLLELVPSTGVPDQLQVHCARDLGHPILGDFKRGFDPEALVPEGAQSRLPDEGCAVRELLQQWYGPGSARGSAPLFLHLHSISVRKARKKPLPAKLPAPSYMRQFVKAMCWSRK